ncbi:MAG: hypothetical protein QXX68_00885 [Candidatus Pacearchaeota archaeon]
MNNKGAVHPAVWVLLGLIIIGATIGTVSYFKNNPTLKGEIKISIEPAVSIGEAINQPSFNWVSFFTGKVPQFLVDKTNAISAVIIVLAIWLILLLTFGDIVAAFGTFSEKWIGWTVGTILAIIAANLNLVMLIAAWSFMFTATLGVFSVSVALAIPFIVFLLLQFGLKRVANWQRARRLMYKRSLGIDRIRTGMRAAAAMGEETESAGENSRRNS